MRTLVFCTAYAEDVSVWSDRYRVWLDAVLAGGWRADQILLVDDGSATLPGWADTAVTSVDTLGDAYTAPALGAVGLVHFRQRLGRCDVLNFPGWHRSFCFAALYAARHQFDRVIHIESDAFVVSARARDYLRDFSEGWAAFWSARYGMPESAIQVAAGEGLRALEGFARAPYSALVGRAHEREMPFSVLAREFRGDRYGEFTDAIPADADYAAQVPSRREQGFLWFLPGRGAARPFAGEVRLGFCAGDDGLGALAEGWSGAEPKHHWRVGGESTLRLRAVAGRGDGVLRLGVTPHVFGNVLTRQRLLVEVNGHFVREFFVTLEAVLGCDVPAAWIGRAGGDIVRLVHPDAVAPCDLPGGAGDGRRLAVSLEWLAWARW
jgi:hypothetical protein